ncbi:glutamate 5-kinase [Microbacterium karelineae]|uniref:glutamate 5-kinase n=1 Tax=Microbacterium karelineae TaxID=2654283 RepID=UPI0012EB0379|nr:glutamate 5-kinase [Microbacterium karelineae]
MTAQARQDLATAKRIVVKVGSSSISGDASWRIDMLADAIIEARSRGQEIILVSSGAIATAVSLMDLGTGKPTDLATQQAAAAVGQNVLLWRWQSSLDRFGVLAGQVLLTLSDLQNSTPRSNARRAIDRMLTLGVLPIVNENDTVATHEIRFGDNDRLSALVAHLMKADALVLLSDITALYTSPPDREGSRPIDTIAADDDLRQFEFGGKVVNSVGTGGAATKATAGRLAQEHGVGALVTSADNIADALAGHDVGTWFAPAETTHPKTEAISVILQDDEHEEHQ